MRKIASGLREHYNLAEMNGKSVLVVCNLKASKMVGFESEGMVLCSKSEAGKTKLLVPPPGAAPGDRVTVDGEEGEPASATSVKKKKTWAKVQKGLKVGEGGKACWDGKLMKVKGGLIEGGEIGGEIS